MQLCGFDTLLDDRQCLLDVGVSEFTSSRLCDVAFARAVADSTSICLPSRKIRVSLGHSADSLLGDAVQDLTLNHQAWIAGIFGEFGQALHLGNGMFWPPDDR